MVCVADHVFRSYYNGREHRQHHATTQAHSARRHFPRAVRHEVSAEAAAVLHLFHLNSTGHFPQNRFAVVQVSSMLQITGTNATRPCCVSSMHASSGSVYSQTAASSVANHVSWLPRCTSCSWTRVYPCMHFTWTAGCTRSEPSALQALQSSMLAGRCCRILGCVCMHGLNDEVYVHGVGAWSAQPALVRNC